MFGKRKTRASPGRRMTDRYTPMSFDLFYIGMALGALVFWYATRGDA